MSALWAFDEVNLSVEEASVVQAASITEDDLEVDMTLAEKLRRTALSQHGIELHNVVAIILPLEEFGPLRNLAWFYNNREIFPSMSRQSVWLIAEDGQMFNPASLKR